jgi:hypothetical protein
LDEGANDSHNGQFRNRNPKYGRHRRLRPRCCAGTVRRLVRRFPTGRDADSRVRKVKECTIIGQ